MGTEFDREETAGCDTHFTRSEINENDWLPGFPPNPALLGGPADGRQSPSPAPSGSLLWLEEFRLDLVAKGDGRDHVRTVCRHVREILLAAAPVPLPPLPPLALLTERGIVRALGAIREKGRSANTLNAYLRDVKHFCRWCVHPAKLLAENPAAYIKGFKIEKDRRHKRTCFPEDQLLRLLETTKASAKLYQGINGADRAALYHAAVWTGARAGTLKLLEAGQFRVEASEQMPEVELRADQTKDAENVTVLFDPREAAVIREHLAGKMPAARAFRMPKHKCDLVKMLRQDLAESGIEYCQKALLENGQTRRMGVLDFHSFRVTFITRSLRDGVDLTEVQHMVGHSTPNLTANIYRQFNLRDTFEKIKRVRPIGGHPRKPGQTAEQD